MEFANVNWIAVIIGMIAAFLLGWLIYSPLLFIKRWAEGSGVDLNDESGPPIFAMTAQIVSLFLLSLVIGITASLDALLTAIIAILTAAAFVISNGAFCKKSPFAITVDGGFIMAAGIVMIVVQGVL